MNSGEELVAWLYRSTLQVDDKWAVQTEHGFTWWAHRHAQTVDVLGEENSPEGYAAWTVSVRTEVLNALTVDDQAATTLNHGLMANPSLAGFVFDDEAHTLSLCSVVAVHVGNLNWIRSLVGMAAALQLYESAQVASKLATDLGAENAVSGHPSSGVRWIPDNIQLFVVPSVVAPSGAEPCQWPSEEFSEVIRQCMGQPPALLATDGGQGLTVEFPYGVQSSLCEMKGDDPHPIYGNGLSVVQSFPVDHLSEAEGARLALSLNKVDLGRQASGYGFGSYSFTGSLIQFRTFLPNVLYRSGLLPSLYSAAAQRARAMSVLLAGKDWTSDSFNIRHSGAGRLVFGPPPTGLGEETQHE